MSTKNQLTGGNFQDTQGNVLANGYLIFELSQDAQVNTNTEICAGFTVRVELNSSGSVDTTSAQDIWPNDVLTPANTFYNVRAFSAAGQLVWGPNPQQVLSTPSPFDVGAWVPASVNVSASLQGQLTVTQATTYTTATAGSATLPSNPVGFVILEINGTNFKVPYYAI